LALALLTLSSTSLGFTVSGKEIIIFARRSRAFKLPLAAWFINCAFLKADAEVFDGLDLAGERPEVGSRLLTAAKQLAVRLPSMCSQELRELLASVLWRIVLRENRIEIKIRSMELRQHLEGVGRISSAGVQ
jgi:hypothetical protein